VWEMFDVSSSVDSAAHICLLLVGLLIADGYVVEALEGFYISLLRRRRQVFKPCEAKSSEGRGRRECKALAGLPINAKYHFTSIKSQYYTNHLSFHLSPSTHSQISAVSIMYTSLCPLPQAQIIYKKYVRPLSPIMTHHVS
jgi:hypothetical protein